MVCHKTVRAIPCLEVPLRHVVGRARRGPIAYSRMLAVSQVLPITPNALRYRSHALPDHALPITHAAR
eukprot:2639693-Prymnesium_polylepis.1